MLSVYVIDVYEKIECPDRTPNVATQETNSIRGNPDAKGLEAVSKEMDLKDWVETCPYD